jgi:hypothetical protein
MARPTHRLDLLLVPALERPIEHGEVWLSAQVASGVCKANGSPGPAAEALVPGGFARLYLDRPTQPTLYANRLGGFRVRCPAAGTPIVEAFSRAVGAWRRGGPLALDCPACGGRHLLDEVDIQPPAAFGPWAVVASDVQGGSFGAEGLAAAREALGPIRVVARRV